MNSDHLTASPGVPTAGAVFHRCALQVNPHHYGGTFRGRETEGDARSHAEAIVVEAAEIGVSVLAVTDHNDVSGVPAFRDAAADRGITVFPGFELVSSEGIHVLCIYPPNTGQERLGRFLGEFGILETAPSSTLSNHSFNEMRCLRKSENRRVFPLLLTLFTTAACSKFSQDRRGFTRGAARISSPFKFQQRSKIYPRTFARSWRTRIDSIGGLTRQARIWPWLLSMPRMSPSPRIWAIVRPRAGSRCPR